MAGVDAGSQAAGNISKGMVLIVDVLISTVVTADGQSAAVVLTPGKWHAAVLP